MIYNYNPPTDRKVMNAQQESYDLEDILCREPRATGTKGLPLELTLKGSDDSDLLLFSLRWSKFQSEWNLGRGITARSCEPLTTVGRISFDLLWNGLCLEDLEGWPGRGMTTGDSFHGIGSCTRATWLLVLDTSTRLVGGSGEGDRSWASIGEVSSSISSNRLCGWIISHGNIPNGSHTAPCHLGHASRCSGALDLVRGEGILEKGLSPRSTVQFRLGARRIALSSQLFRYPWRTIA